MKQEYVFTSRTKRGQNLGKSPSTVSMSTLSSIPPCNKGLTTSSMTRKSVVLTPRQLAPTVGPAHAGVEILGGARQGMEGFVSGRITRSRRGKLTLMNRTGALNPIP